MFAVNNFTQADGNISHKICLFSYLENWFQRKEHKREFITEGERI